VAAGLGCTENLAIQRVTYARRWLGAFIAEHEVEVIATWYRGAVGGVGIPDVRAGQALVAEYVARQEGRLREDWRSAARVLWAQRTCGSEAERRERVAVAAG
jgi:hypothetical protein